MSKQKLRVKSTDLDNLISNLRGEVGEILTSWVLLRYMINKERELMSDDIAKDIANQNLAFVSALRDKLTDEVVARLSELGEAKIGRLTFHFAATKLKKLDIEAREFSTFISRKGFRKKRNYDISHKELPEKWSQHKHIAIRYRTLLRGVGLALRLMKTIDGVVLGPAAKYLWREMRKKRYELVNPAKAAYILLPHLNLSREVRERVIMEEMTEGRQVWSEMTTTVNGQQTRISACREWGALVLGGRMIVLDHYPLQELKSVNIPPPDSTAAAGMLAQPEPITEEREITAKYRVAKRSEAQISFAPVKRVQLLGKGTLTELVDIHIRLNDKLRRDFGGMNVGDEKDFTLTVNVLFGYGT